MYILNPEVSGQIGEKTLLNTNTHPPIVERLHFIFYGWLGDDLIECFPCFLVSEKLKILLQKTNFSGFLIKDCETELSEEILIMQPQIVLPKFYWLDVGHDKNSDLFIDESLKLQVTDAAYDLLKRVNLKYCDIQSIEV